MRSTNLLGLIIILSVAMAGTSTADLIMDPTQTITLSLVDDGEGFEGLTITNLGTDPVDYTVRTRPGLPVVAGKMLAASFTEPQLVLDDPFDDSDPFGTDFMMLKASFDIANETIRLVISFSGPLQMNGSYPDLNGIIDLDTDHDASTGESTLLDYYSDGAIDVGAEYRLDFGQFRNTGKVLLENVQTLSTILRFEPTEIDLSSIILEFPFPLLGNNVSSINVGAVFGSGSDVLALSDYAPESGHGTIQSELTVPWIQLTSVSGTVAGGASNLVTFVIEPAKGDLEIGDTALAEIVVTAIDIAQDDLVLPIVLNVVTAELGMNPHRIATWTELLPGFLLPGDEVTVRIPLRLDVAKFIPDPVRVEETLIGDWVIVDAGGATVNENKLTWNLEGLTGQPADFALEYILRVPGYPFVLDAKLRGIYSYTDAHKKPAMGTYHDTDFELQDVDFNRDLIVDKADMNIMISEWHQIITPAQ